MMKYIAVFLATVSLIVPTITLAASVPQKAVVQIQEVTLIATVTKVKGTVISVKSEQGKTYTLAFSAKASMVGPTGKTITKKDFRVSDRLRATGVIKGSMFTASRLRNLGKAADSASSNTVAPMVQKPTTNSYTLLQVATHKDASSCWSVIEGSVYDLTNWISGHPGGKNAILGICGKDGTTAFNGRHGSQAQPKTTLETFKIGTLQK